tara:strand:+ start:1707 stop:2057 length:351 start_codon:yes stop_codon:yes gene_type:complete
MANKFDSLTIEQSNLIVLKTLCILDDNRYSQLANWPFEDISINDLFAHIKVIHSSLTLRENFINFCLDHIRDNKKRYSIIEGIMNMITLFENLERYEDCIILKNIKDNILLDLQRV